MNYCKLYIDSPGDIRAVGAIVEDLWLKIFSEDHDVFYSLHKNENYSDAEEKNLVSSPVKRSKFYMEIDAPDEMEGDKFKGAVALLIVGLRRDVDYVVASCEFEDYIVDVTGWNWVQGG